MNIFIATVWTATALPKQSSFYWHILYTYEVISAEHE